MAGMGNKHRRLAGVLSLALAIAMLIAGQTVWQESLTGRSFVVFWLVCFLFTVVALFAALFEMRSVGSQAREQQRELLRQTLSDVERDAKSERRKRAEDDSAE